MGDGETGLNMKLWARKMPIEHVPGARLYHHIPKSRLSFDYLLARARNQGRADGFTSFRSHGGGPLSASRELARSVGKSALYLVPAIGHKGRTDPHSVEIQTQLVLATARSRFAIRLVLDKGIRRFAPRDDWLGGDRANV